MQNLISYKSSSELILNRVERFPLIPYVAWHDMKIFVYKYVTHTSILVPRAVRLPGLLRIGIWPVLRIKLAGAIMFITYTKDN